MITCHGYSYSSVSTPPTILVTLLASPQLQITAAAVVFEVAVDAEIAADIVEGEVVVDVVGAKKRIYMVEI